MAWNGEGVSLNFPSAAARRAPERPAMLTDEECAFLVRHARDALRAVVLRDVPPPDAVPPASWTALHAEGGVFVTLKTDGALRGCLGCFRHAPPLYATVAEYARASALDDPRFDGRRLRPDEWPRIAMDISVLSPLAPCADPLGIRLGVDGIYVQCGGRSGCFLPQVATETGWDAATFWERCAVDKAGLPPGAWRGDAPSVRRWTFTAQVIVDPAPSEHPSRTFPDA